MAQVAAGTKGHVKLREEDNHPFWITQFFQDMVCWFKCLFHDCSCYHHDMWQGSDDSDMDYRRARLAKEKAEREAREKAERERLERERLERERLARLRAMQNKKEEAPKLKKEKKKEEKKADAP